MFWELFSNSERNVIGKSRGLCLKSDLINQFFAAKQFWEARNYLSKPPPNLIGLTILAIFSVWGVSHICLLVRRPQMILMKMVPMALPTVPIEVPQIPMVQVNLFQKPSFLHHDALKFIYSEKATKFCEIFPLLLTGTA